MSRPLWLPLFLVLTSASVSFGFAPPTTKTTTIPRISSSPSSTRLFGIRWDPTKTQQDTLDEKVFVDFPTPNQRKVIKKEISKRLARKQMPTFVMPDIVKQVENDDDTLFPVEVLEQIWNEFYQQETEVLQIRGLSRQDKKYVFAAAEHLCWELEDVKNEGIDMEEDDVDKDVQAANSEEEEEEDDEEEDAVFHQVSLISTKGHAAMLYCPTILDASPNHSNKIVLHTSVGQKNTWKPRLKPPRDARGQVIPKELREEYYRKLQEQEEGA